MEQSIANDHDLCVSHNDINPFNFIVTHMDKASASVILSDCGISNNVNNTNNITNLYGTMNFVATEYFDEN